MTQTQTPDHETWQLAQWAREDVWAAAHGGTDCELEDEDDD